jgi:hypothetical protein
MDVKCISNENFFFLIFYLFCFTDTQQVEGPESQQFQTSYQIARLLSCAKIEDTNA